MYIHDYTMKQYKPGQFVSIGGKLARVCITSPLTVCRECRLANGWETENYCFLSSGECIKKLGPNLYPKLICGNQAK